MAKKATSKSTKASETERAKPRAKTAIKPASKAKKPRFQEKAPEAYVFWCCDGRKFSDMQEFAEGLLAISDETYAYHANAEKNDFCNWVRDIILDVELAVALSEAQSRADAARRVSDRVAFLIAECD
jgi:hypothetical protein